MDTCTSCMVLGWGWDGGPNECANDEDPVGTVCFNSSCQIRPCFMFIGQQVCASAQTYWVFTPISLLWDGAQELVRSGPAVEFPLSPTEQGKSYMWYASAKAPLLVYDPEHKGEITTAAQLFGNWTFGGRQAASLETNESASDAAPSEAGPWQNGYQALATLDADNDGKISGSELEALGLWFDRNQNGVSEPGEVTTLAEAAVDVLYYEADERNPSGSIYAHRGYERVIDGKRVTGASVDWYAEHGDNPTSLLFNVLTARGSAEHAAASEDNEAVPGAAAGQPDFNGVWRWTSSDPALPPDGADGVLSFNDRGGKLTGHTLNELKLRPGLDIATSLHVLSFKGEKRIDPQTSRQIAVFTTPLPDGSQLRNTAELSADGKSLQGRTEAVVQLAGGEKIVSYSWTAKRVEK